MIFDGEFVTGIDMVDVALWTFVLFFFGLIFYLRREDRREGYPLESDTTGKLEDNGVFWYAPKKTFVLPHKRGTVSVPHGRRDTRELAMTRTAVWPGSPYQPNGDAMKAAVGPGAYAERDDVPDLADDGRNRLAPFRMGDGFYVPEGDGNPVGMTVYGVDGKAAGEVVDLWVDRSEALIRYMEVNIGTAEAPNHVLLPMPFTEVSKGKNRVTVNAIKAHHFADVPRTKSSDSVTRLEEDMIAAYYGGGTLYSDPQRAEPLI